MKAIDDEGREVNAVFSVDEDAKGLFIMLESRSGGPNSPRYRNPEYDDALRLLLGRLAGANGTLVRALVESSRVRHLSEAERTIQLVAYNYPIRLADVSRHGGIEALRKDLCTGQRPIGAKPDAIKRSGSGKWTRIRLEVAIPGYGPGAAVRLAELLVDGDIARREYEREVRVESLPGFTGTLDRTGSGLRRGEQPYLRKVLGLMNPAKPQDCALCGHVYHPRFLVAAHIKPRANCTIEEKLDVRNIAMRACLFGCDALYEHRVVFVDADGIIRASPDASALDGLHIELRRCVGRKCDAFRPETAPYFAWHRDNPRR